jgi:parvulin-like peptidyl-prolyl isomerase
MLAFAGILGCGSPEPLADDVLVRWQGGEISRAEFDDFVLTLPAKKHAPKDDQTVAEWRKKLLEGLVARQLLIAEAESMVSSHPELQASLKVEELTRLADSLAARFAAGLPPISDEEIRDHYEENRETYDRGDLLNIRHIYLRFFDSDSEDARAAKVTKMESLRTRAVAGESFASLAREYSESENAKDGGVIHMFGRGYSFEAFEDAAFALDEGEISPVFTSKRGVHLIQLETRYPGRTKSLEETTAAIRAKLKRQRLHNEVERIDVELSETYPAEIDLAPLREPAVDPATTIIRVGDEKLTVGEFQTVQANWQSLLRNETLDATIEDYVRRMRFALEARARGFDSQPGVIERIRMSCDSILHGWLVERKMKEAAASIDVDELRTFFEDHPDLFDSPRRIRASRIFLKCEPDELYQTFLEAEALVRRIRAGESFAELAREHSDGPLAQAGGQLPLLGPQGVRRQGKEFFETVATLDVGEVSDPVRCPHVVLAPGVAREFVGGILIARVDEIEEARPLEFAEAEDAVRRIFMQKHRARIREQIDEQALAGFRLEFNESALSAP